MDPIHRQLLTCSYEALQHAGYNPGASLSMEGHNVSTFFGQLGEDWHDIIHQKGADIYYVPGIARTFAPSRVNYHYKFGGGSYAVDSACASSITTIVLACQALQSRACDMALAGGGNMIYTPVPYSGLSRSGMISPTDGCRTFHDDADGYARGEGVGVVVLKRLEDALSDNDNILGVIRGSARTFSTTTTSITHPSHESQERVYKRVLAQSSVDASEIAYVEMHGTGTQAGDWEEMTSVLNVMAPQGSRTKDNPLTVGTVKAAIGHGEAAAGVTALIKSLLMLRDRVIPAQPGWPFKINHRFPALEPCHVRIATQLNTLKPSPKGNKKIKIMVNSFDASGGESCLLIEEPPTRKDFGTECFSDPRTTHVVALSGKTTYALAENRRRLLEWLDLHPDAKLADVAYTTTARRMHEPLRAAYVATSITELAQQLEDAIVNGEDPKSKVKPSGRVFLFTGQGSHYAGMGSLLFDTNTSFKKKLLSLQEIATHLALPDFVSLISNPDAVDHATTTQTQLATVSLEICVAELLATYGVTPTAVLGHSLGEYAALCIAGVLSVADTLYLVGQRAFLMEVHLAPNTYAMLATSASPEVLEATYTSLGLTSCNIACKNAPALTVASGTVADIEMLQVSMKKEGSRCTVLRIPYGFHSAQVEPILDEYTQLANGVDFKAPAIPVASSFLGRIIDVGDRSVFGPQYLREQCRGTVDFVGALNAIALLEKSSINQVLWMEMGPDSTLSGLTRKTLPGLPLHNFLPTFKPNPNEDNWKLLSTILKGAYESGLDVNWPEFHKSYHGFSKLLELPLYAFQYRNFWHEPFEDPETLLVKNGSFVPASAVIPPLKAETLVRPSCHWFPNTSLQVVNSEEINEQTNTMVTQFTSDTAYPALVPAIEGHVVFQNIICPMSVLVDMALTAARYCHFRLHDAEETPVMSITDINMSHALVLHPNEPRRPLVRVTAIMRKHTRSVEILFTWVKFGDGKAAPSEEAGGTCMVHFEEDKKWLPGVINSLFLVKSRIASLRSSGLSGQAHRLLKPVIYRMFSETVNYSTPFRGIEEAILDISCQDAVAKVTLPADIPAGNFTMNPFWTDALTHLGGFLLNSGLRYGESDFLCMARGFDSWRVVSDGTEMQPGRTYTCYTFMQEAENGYVVGDCYILDEMDNLVQTLLGLKFQKLRKAVFQAVFGVSPNAVTANRPKMPERNQQLHESVVAPLPKSASKISKPILQEPSTASYISCIDPQQLNSTALLPSIEEPSNIQDSGNVLLSSIFSVIAKEAGCLPEDLTEDAVFADLGIDSLMGISVLSVIKHETGIDLDPTFFIDYATLSEARAALKNILGLDTGSTSSIATPMDIPSTPTPVSGMSTIAHEPVIYARDNFDTFTPPSEMADANVILADLVQDPVSLAIPKSVLTRPSIHSEALQSYKLPVTSPVDRVAARLVHLSGPKASPTTQLFLLPDESGSSLACIQLPAAFSAKGNPITVWGVESPFAKDPSLLARTSVSELANISSESIREHQRKRPGRFLLGGFSAGAAMAIEVARQMKADTNEDFAGLVLLDPSLTPSEVLAVANAPSTHLKPPQKLHVTNTIDILKDHVSAVLNLAPVRGKATAIMSPTHTPEQSKILSQILPDVQFVISEAAPKGMGFPGANSTGGAYHRAIQDMALV
jgi:iterative type I PKS product template protein